jgi:lysozyme
MAMKTSSEGVSLIKSFEGCRLRAYKCPAGIWTIGYGHTDGVKEGDTITQETADDYLRNDLAKYEKAVLKYDGIYHFNQNQFDTLVSFTYNCGVGNLKNLTQNGKRTLAQISAKLPLYNKAGGVVLKGLQRRRAAEKELFDTHVNSNKTDTTLYYEKYTGDSPRVDEVLASIEADKDYDNAQTKAYLKRKPIADANAIKNYTGTATQNNKIIKLAKDGKLRRV